MSAMNSTTSREKYARIAPVIRTALFFIILAWMALGPAYRQVLGGSSQIFRPWIMFKNAGIDPDTEGDLMDATFYVAANGELKEINRFEVLGYGNPKHAPVEVFRITGESGIEFVAERLCEKLGNGADLRVKARAATTEGWKARYRAENNLCGSQHDTVAQ